MRSNYYEKIKQLATGNLKEKYEKNKGVLEAGDISDEIENIRQLLDLPESLKEKIFRDREIALGDESFERMQKELETLFNVKLEAGLIIKGEEQQERDTTWWSNKLKIVQEDNSENYYWHRYKKYINSFLPPEVVKTLDDDTDVIIDNIGNPESESFDRYGMVVGHVQSGKTSNYAAVVCKAADAGYKFIVIIAGDKNNLRNQTQKRINESFLGKNIDNKRIGVGLIDFRQNKLPISLTTVEKDFNSKDADKNSQGMNFDNINTPILLVIKKNTSTLSSVISWLRNQYRNKISNHAMLVIDDESDYASINTKEDDDPTTINKKIRALLGMFHKSSYVAYTATPYANIFIDHQAEELDNIRLDNKNKDADLSKDLFPRDFIYALEAPTNYFGAKKIFLDEKEKFIIEIDDYEEVVPLKHKKEYADELPGLPQSLCEAIALFLLNISIRNLRGQEGMHNSILVHISRFSDMHSKIAFFINEYLEEIKAELVAYGKLTNAVQQSKNIEFLQKVFNKIHKNNIEFEFFDILYKLAEIVKTVVVREEHQKSKTRIEYRNDIPANIIAVGGMSLSRGFTLEGLHVSYFIRSTIFYDTLMQMGRWFGYRSGYEDLCRIYMPSFIAEYFAQIIEATEELMNSFKEMAKEEKTPLDFGLAVKQHPDSLLQVTARNKRKNTATFMHTMNLNGTMKETVRFDKNIVLHRENFEIMEKFISSLDIVPSTKKAQKENHYIWKNINSKNIETFFNDFKVYQKNHLDISMPIKFIQAYAKKINTNWDVVLYSGTEKQTSVDNFTIFSELRSKYVDKGNYIELGQRKLSTGTPELTAITNPELLKEIHDMKFPKGEKTKFIRQRLERPILMLHILYLPNFCDAVPAYGVCFPDKGFDSSQTVEYLINTVAISSLLEEEEFDD